MKYIIKYKEYVYIFSEKMALTTAQLEKSKKNIPYSANRRTLSNQQHAFQFTTHFTVREKSLNSS